MVRQKVVDYVRGLIQKGYSVSSIKDVMLKYGYSNSDIDAAISEVYHPTVRHEIHFSKAVIFVIVFVVIVGAGVALFLNFYNPKAPSQLLDLKLEPVKTDVQAGENAAFIKQMSNLGSSKRYDVVVNQEILDSKTYNVITHSTETIGIETASSTKTEISVPKNTKPGDYLLRVIAEYNGNRAVATLPMKVTAPGKKESCFDGIKNQNEENTDCGGACKPCEIKTEDCNDSNPCTSDTFADGKCANAQITPCCGNGICEENEKATCSADCKEQQPEAGQAPEENINDIKELAKTNPNKALQQCNSIEVPDIKDTCISSIGDAQQNKNYCSKISNSRIKDTCLSSIAKSTNDNSVCTDIQNDGIRDSCYANFFVAPNKDYSVCSKITNNDLRQSCGYLRQLNDINEEIRDP